MPLHQFYLWLAKACWVVFVVAFGGCVGSLINVLVYRMPRGIGVVTPPSRCPACGTRLTWRENIPVLGWVLLRGRCRFCRSKISAEYPLVEAFTGGLFGVFLLLWYLVPPGRAWGWLGMIRPEWALNDPSVSWPSFLVLLMLLGSLVAMTIVDAKTYTIPLALPWFATAVGVIVHPIHAAWVQATMGALPRTAPEWRWSIADAGWWWVGASVGGVLGIGVSMLLVRSGLIRRSFADYDEWEAGHRLGREASPGAGEPPPSLGLAEHQPPRAAAAVEAGGLGPAAPDVPIGGHPDVWLQYPHARREMFKEVVFLSSPVVLGMLGGAWASRLGSRGGGGGEPPLWLGVLGGVLMGYLIGGGIVWVVRIVGSVGFGKEAMGMGDVHLMAAVGACLGWIDAALAFFGAAFVGLAWVGVGVVLGGKLRRAMPYGPYLAAATLLVLLCKPLVERGLTALLRVPPGLPPINIP